MMLTRIMEEGDIVHVAKLISQCFSQHNDLNIYLGMTEMELFLYTTSIANHIVSQGLSVVAVVTDADVKIVGACIVFDFKTDFTCTAATSNGPNNTSNSVVKMSHNLDLIYEFLDGLDALALKEYFHSKDTTEFAYGDCAFLSLVAIHIDYNGRGIFRQMLSRIVDIVTTKGMKCIYTQATHPATSKGMMSLGQEYQANILASLPINSFVTKANNHHAFLNMEGDADAIVIDL